MALEADQAKWIYQFTAGAVPLPVAMQPAPGDTEGLKQLLEVAQAREWAEEQALKRAMLAKAFTTVDARKEELREAFDLDVEVKSNPDDTSPAEWDEDGEKKSKKVGKTKKLRDPKGRQEKAFEAAEAGTMAAVPEGLSTTHKIGDIDKPQAPDFTKEAKLSANNAYKIVVDESDKLGAAMTRRSRIDAKAGTIVTASERLFTDREIADELYTPLVREIVVPETIIAPKFSATQQMIEGSNDYYLNECRSKGKKVPMGVADLAKGAVNLAATVTTTVLAAVGPVAAGKDALHDSGKLTKEAAARATNLTTGIAAALCGAIDAVDKIDDFRESGDFSVAGYKAVLNSFAVMAGKIVAGAVPDPDSAQGLGMIVTDSLSGAISLSTMVPRIVQWRRKGGEPPVGALIDDFGGMLSSGLSAVSDKTSGNVSTNWVRAAASVSAVFGSAAAAVEGKIVAAMKKGDWGTVFSLLGGAATKAASGLPLMIVLAPKYNAIDADTKEEYASQQTLITVMAGTSTGLDGAGTAANDLSRAGLEAAAKTLGITLPPMPSAKQQAAIEKQFAARQEQMDAAAKKEAEAEIANIETQMAAEKQEYQDGLKCLGSTNPSDAEFKSIAKLVEQLERDRKIWDGLMALLGGGFGAAGSLATSLVAEAVAPLKMAGQLVKYIANVKAASDRLSAWLDWREGQKDAESAVSAYATSIDNFARNQGKQFTHYTLQAASNAIQAMLAVGEMTQFAPAFKVAGASVAAAAAVEDLAFKFYKQVALKRAWNATKAAFDPKNRGNRNMALLVRQVNPTLAKYTLAYGALIEESPIAITAMNRIGLDRETLTRAGDGVAALKDYLEKLYPDDGTAIGVMDAAPGTTKVPAAALTSKAWALSHLLWTEKEGLATPNPPMVVANLALAEPLLAAKRDTLDEDDLNDLVMALVKLESAFRSFDPRTASSSPLPGAAQVVEVYTDLAWAAAKGARMDLDALTAVDA